MRLRQLRPEPDVDQFHGTAPVRGEHVHGLERAEGDGRRSGDGGPVDRSRVGVDAAGRVDGQHRGREALRDADELGRGRTQRAAAGQADDAVEHEVRTRDRGGAVGPVRDDPAPRPAQRGETLRVGPLRIEEHSGDPDAPTAQFRPGPQGVAAVVAGSHEERDAPSAAVGQHPPGDDGEPEGGTAHQGARRDPCQHHLLGGAHLLGGEDLAHPGDVSATVWSWGSCPPGCRT